MVEIIKSMDEFKALIQSSKKVVVDCYADWCGPCKMLAPVVESVSEQLTDIKFVKVNIDNVDEIAQIFQIYSIPALLCIEDTVLKTKIVGFRNESTLKAELNRVF